MTNDLVQRLLNSQPRKICGHGMQEVKCPHCENAALEDEIERLRAEVAAIAYERDGLRPQVDGLRAALEERTAYVVTHRGMALSCGNSMRQAYSDEKVRADHAESALAALRKRVATCRCSPRCLEE